MGEDTVKGKGTGRGRYHHGDLRGALLDAAEALVRERGVDGWSLREASARVGVSPSAAYHHFSSRDALVGALSLRVLGQLGERMGRAADLPAEADPHRRLVAVGQAYVRAALEDPAVTRLAFGAGASPAGRGSGVEPLESGVDPLAPHPHRVLDAELDLLALSGHLTPAARTGADFVVWTAVHGLAALLADGLIAVDGPEAADRQTERTVRATLTGLHHEATPSEPWPTPHSAHTTRAADGPHP
ncbi:MULTISPECIES: TetR/AcrR family transcriptional regulator [Streptomyces]|uniref:TetR/AcrR family transcriptional regulator n=1 Tax=Streptomyces TaxID=1883 RepID=UPI000F656FC4|nr:TetR/AcrR family transcriptional regulator [Streptomyces alboflavus]